MYGMGMGGMGGMGMMGMGMGMPMMPGMGMPMGMPMPFGMPIPDFAGPGGPGSTQPYRPPDPSALPAMPAGLPFIARPGQEGFDQYGRLIPPPLPEGWDGWGRPIVGGASQAPPAPAKVPNIPPPGPHPPAGGQDPTPTHDMPVTSHSNGSGGSGGTPLSAETGRPEQPPCFDRPPAAHDSYFGYDDFEPFALSAGAMNEAWKLHLPRELIGHDVNADDWKRFIADLRKEALANVQHGGYDYNAVLRDDLSRNAPPPRGPVPLLTDTVHSLLASWAVAFFLPRGVRVYAAQDGKRVIPPPIEPHGRSRRGYSRADEFSDTAESASESNDSEWWSDEEQRRREDMWLPRRERNIRSKERMRERRMQKRLKEFEANQDRYKRRGRGKGHRTGSSASTAGGGRGGRAPEWEIHFLPTQPTLWQAGMRPRTYGEPVVRMKR